MKIKSIVSICKKTGVCCWFNDSNGAQWLGDGCAVYKLEKLPPLDEANVFTVLGVSKKQKDGMLAARISPPKSYDFGDCAEHEEKAEYSEIGIVEDGVYGGIILRPLYTSRGLRFINAKYLEPLKDDEDTLTPYERISTNGQSYIAIKRNSSLVAVIMPYKVGKDTVERLQALARDCELALKMRQGQERQGHGSNEK